MRKTVTLMLKLKARTVFTVVIPWFILCCVCVGGDAQGPLKNALQQIQSVRTDSSSLLQTIYLGEIGLQSMADVSKTASPGGGSGAALSMFSSSADPVAENSHDDMYADTEGDSLGKHSSPQADDNQPKSKKM